MILVDHPTAVGGDVLPGTALVLALKRDAGVVDAGITALPGHLDHARDAWHLCEMSRSRVKSSGIHKYSGSVSLLSLVPAVGVVSGWMVGSGTSG